VVALVSAKITRTIFCSGSFLEALLSQLSRYGVSPEANISMFQLNIGGIFGELIVAAFSDVGERWCWSEYI
jgi:hypothetical protein